jgi:hypothetical protein
VQKPSEILGNFAFLIKLPLVEAALNPKFDKND